MFMETDTYSVIITGSIIFCILALAIVTVAILAKGKVRERQIRINLLEKQGQVDNLATAARAAQDEKVKLSSHIHDKILPIVNNASTKFAAHIRDLEYKGANVTPLRNEMAVFSDLHENLRDVIQGLVPKLLTSFGLLKALEVEIKTINKEYNFPAEFHNNTTFAGEFPLTLGDQLTVFLICKEILNNLQKHAKYEYLSVSLENVSENVELLFAHDGKSLNNDEIRELRESTPGMGLKLLQSKLIQLGAKLDYSRDEETAFIRLSVPTKKNEKTN